MSILRDHAILYIYIYIYIKGGFMETVVRQLDMIVCHDRTFYAISFIFNPSVVVIICFHSLAFGGIPTLARLVQPCSIYCFKVMEEEEKDGLVQQQQQLDGIVVISKRYNLVLVTMHHQSSWTYH
jgi:hypothetical protein